MLQALTDLENNIHNSFVMCGKNAKEWMRKCILLLPDIEKYEIWKKKGFESIYVYAAKLAGMSRNTVDDALRILRKIEDKPELIKLVEEKGVNAVRPVVTIATGDSAGFWAEKARIMSKNTLETYVREFRTSTEIHNTKDYSETVKASNNITMELDPEIAQQLEKLKGDGDWNELMMQFLKMREEKLEEQKPESAECESRYIPAKIKNFVIARTNGRCAFPACNKPLIILHHTQRFALENVHDSDRLHGLCKAHERIAHLGLIENEELAPKFWKLLAEPDRNAPKYEIDIIVNKFRMASG